MSARFAFLTLGQTPRTDLVPEILSWMPEPVEVHEVGALDGLGIDEIAALAPGRDEPRLVTRLRDGRQAVLREDWVRGRLQELLDRLDPQGYRAVVLLCTGEFPGLAGRGLFLDAQHLVDHGAAALSSGAHRVGLLLPLLEQVDTFHYRAGPKQQLAVSHASPYEGDRFEEAGRELAGTDLVLMHCMGYTEAQRRVVARASRRPTLLARRLVAAALAQLL